MTLCNKNQLLVAVRPTADERGSPVSMCLGTTQACARWAICPTAEKGSQTHMLLMVRALQHCAPDSLISALVCCRTDSPASAVRLGIDKILPYRGKVVNFEITICFLRSISVPVAVSEISIFRHAFPLGAPPGPTSMLPHSATATPTGSPHKRRLPKVPGLSGPGMMAPSQVISEISTYIAVKKLT